MAGAAKPPPGPLSKAIADQLRAKKAILDTTDEIIAKSASGISRPQLRGILKGEKHVDLEQLDRICSALGLDMVKVVRQADVESSGRRIGWGVKPIVRK